MEASAIEQFTWVGETRILGPAEILEVNSAGQQIRLRLAGSDDDLGVWAQIAIAAVDLEIHEGDEVLVIGENPRELYVIGVLGKAKIGSHTPKKLLLNGGTCAIAGTPEEQILRVFSGRNELLFEYDEAKHKARVNVDCGDLEFVAHNGNIAFSSGRDVLIQGKSVDISSASTISLKTANAAGELSATGVELRGPEVRVSAERGDIQIAETAVTGTRFLANYQEGKLIVDRFEAVLQILTEKAKNVFRSVEQLAQIRAGRIRTLVASTYFFKARKAFLKSDEDYKIKAEKIHLG
jgi:hypothetical protein